MERINRNEDMRRLRELVREHGVKQIVVGLPLRLDGTRGDMAEEVERFASACANRSACRWNWWMSGSPVGKPSG